jgi:hypothetical protein
VRTKEIEIRQAVISFVNDGSDCHRILTLACLSQLPKGGMTGVGKWSSG